jgi:hypothetical protein
MHCSKYENQSKKWEEFLGCLAFRNQDLNWAVYFDNFNCPSILPKDLGNGDINAEDYFILFIWMNGKARCLATTAVMLEWIPRCTLVTCQWAMSYGADEEMDVADEPRRKWVGVPETFRRLAHSECSPLQPSSPSKWMNFRDRVRYTEEESAECGPALLGQASYRHRKRVEKEHKTNHVTATLHRIIDLLELRS